VDSSQALVGGGACTAVAAWPTPSLDGSLGSGRVFRLAGDLVSKALSSAGVWLTLAGRSPLATAAAAAGLATAARLDATGVVAGSGAAAPWNVPGAEEAWAAELADL